MSLILQMLVNILLNKCINSNQTFLFLALTFAKAFGFQHLQLPSVFNIFTVNAYNHVIFLINM